MTDLARRNFLRASGKKTQQPLPWIISPTHFYAHCTRCNLCIDSCATKIISIGDGGFPTIDFSKGECSFCYQCAQVCETNIFKPRTTEPWQQSITIANDCLAFNKIACRSCEDFCESAAIVFKPLLGSPSQPLVNSELCNGCGACIKPCPTQSITITRNNSGN